MLLQNYLKVCADFSFTPVNNKILLNNLNDDYNTSQYKVKLGLIKKNYKIHFVN